MGPVGVFGTVERPPRQHRREFDNPDAEHLPREDMTHPRLQFGDLGLQSVDQALGYLPQEHTRLGAWIEEGEIRVGPDAPSVMVHRPGIRQGVEHPVGELGRGEHLIVRKIGDTGENVRVAPFEGEGGLAHAVASGIAS